MLDIMLYTRLYTMVYSLVYSLHASCYNVSLTSTASAIASLGRLPCIVRNWQVRSKASNSSVLKSGIPASRAAKGFSKLPGWPPPAAGSCR